MDPYIKFEYIAIEFDMKRNSAWLSLPSSRPQSFVCSILHDTDSILKTSYHCLIVQVYISIRDLRT